MKSGARATGRIAGVIAAVAVALAALGLLSYGGWLLPEPVAPPTRKPAELSAPAPDAPGAGEAALGGRASGVASDPSSPGAGGEGGGAPTPGAEPAPREDVVLAPGPIVSPPGLESGVRPMETGQTATPPDGEAPALGGDQLASPGPGAVAQRPDTGALSGEPGSAGTGGTALAPPRFESDADQPAAGAEGATAARREVGAEAPAPDAAAKSGTGSAIGEEASGGADKRPEAKSTSETEVEPGQAAPAVTGRADTLAPVDGEFSAEARVDEGVPAGPSDETRRALAGPGDTPQAGTEPFRAPEAEALEQSPADGAPRLDIVRVERDGAALVAGTAEPNALVSITLDGQTIDQAVAGPDGSFVAFVDLPSMDAPRPLRLQSERAGGVQYSEQTVLIVPPERADEAAQPAVVVADSAGVRLVQPEVPVASDAGAPAPEAGADTAPARPLPLALDTITYDETGEVVLAGRGAGKAHVRIYVDNEPLATEPVPADGSWRAVLPDLDKGTYTLRVDQIDETGKVVARVESPFRRESPAALAEAAARSGTMTSVTVQPGHTLWAIARDRYGSGFRYVQIFRANRDKIRDPDLIYPGQVFDLPPDPAE